MKFIASTLNSFSSSSMNLIILYLSSSTFNKKYILQLLSYCTTHFLHYLTITPVLKLNNIFSLSLCFKIPYKFVSVVLYFSNLTLLKRYLTCNLAFFQRISTSNYPLSLKIA